MCNPFSKVAKAKNLAEQFIAEYGITRVKNMKPSELKDEVNRWTSQRGDANMRGLLMGFILLIIGLALIGPAISFVFSADDATLSSYTGAAAILHIVPLFIVLGVVAVAAVQVIRAFQGKGLGSK